MVKQTINVNNEIFYLRNVKLNRNNLNKPIELFKQNNINYRVIKDGKYYGLYTPELIDSDRIAMNKRDKNKCVLGKKFR